MDKRINDEQNKTDNLNCLASQRYLYSSAKNLMGWQVFFNVILIVVASFVVYAFNNEWFGIKCDYSAHLALLSVITTVLNSLLLVPMIKSKKELAAKIQERFDTRVLSLDWNTINIGNVPGSEDIKIYSQKYKEKHQRYTGLDNWYSSVVDGVPLHVGRFICQRANLSWDVYLREKYIKYIVAFSVVFSILIAVFGFLSDPNLKDFVLNIATPLLPIAIFCIEQYRDNKESIDNIKNLRQDLNSSWQDMLSNPGNVGVDAISRRIQDEIYKNRKDNQLIFDWIYNKYRGEMEEAMYYSVDDMIAEYNQAVSP
jgi:hypothetical protein